MSSDAQLCARLRAGDAAAVRELLERDHAVADFFVRVVAVVAGADVADRVVSDAWETVIADIVSGTVTEGLRAAVLGRVAVALEFGAPGEQRPAVPDPFGAFNPTGDRWEGWWKDEPPAWPKGAVPQPEQVLRALRRLPTRQRAALVLRDVARLPVAQVAAVLDDASDLSSLLDSARDAYLVELDREVGRA